jgi:hypothetical protein
MVIFLPDTTIAKSQAPLDIPNISVIGNMVGSVSEDEKKFGVNAIEFSYQSSIYPSVKVDIFTALHQEENEMHFNLEEGYVTFLDPIGLMLSNSELNLGVGAIVGRKLLPFGKLSVLHPEQWQFVDQPIAIQTFLGGSSHGVAAEGGQLLAALPFPFFSQLEIGAWTALSHEDHGAENHEESESHEPESHHDAHNGAIKITNRVVTARIWNSVSLGADSEFELGLSGLLSNVTADSDHQYGLVGLDLTLVHAFSLNQHMKLQGELLRARYGEEDDRATQVGGYVTSILQFSPKNQIGVRASALGKHGDEGDTQVQYTTMYTRQLTETSKFRAQYTLGENVESTFKVQFIFGMGPHSHVLQ